MRRTGKRLLSVLLVFVLATSMLPASALAADLDPAGGPNPEIEELALELGGGLAVRLAGAFTGEEDLELRAAEGEETAALQQQMEDELGCTVKDFAAALLADAEADTVLSQELTVTVSGEALPDEPLFAVVTEDGSVAVVEAEPAEEGAYVFTADVFGGLLYAAAAETEEPDQTENPDETEQTEDPGLFGAAAVGEEKSSSYIQEFYVTFDYSDDTETTEYLVNGDTDYVWTPGSPAKGHLFKFRIDYTLSGYFTYNAEEIEIRIPKSILRDRAGGNADEYELSIPVWNANGLPENRVFVYREDGDDIVIYNRIGCPAAQKGYIDVGYYTSKQTFEYKDYDPDGETQDDRNASEPFCGTLTISRAGEAPISANSNEIPVFINTSARLLRQIKSHQAFYRQWQSAWGTAPADAGEYYYLLWVIRSDIKATQPYRFTLTDTPLGCIAPEGTEIPMEVIGYRLQGQNAYTILSAPVTEFERTWENQKSNYANGRFDYILTRHPIAACVDENGDPLSEYTLKNGSTGEVTSVDDGVETSSDDSATWTYIQPVFHPIVGELNPYKYGLDFQNAAVSNSEQIRNLALDDFNSGLIDTIDDLAWKTGFNAALYDLTATDVNDYNTYGTNSVTYELYDNTLKLRTFGLPFNNDDYVPLGAEDYRIDNILFSWTMRDADFDDEELVFVPKTVSYADDEVLEIYAQFGGDTSSWTRVGTYNLADNTKTLTDAASNENRTMRWTGQILRVSYTDDATADDHWTGYRVVTSNKHYTVALSATLHVTLLRSDAVTNAVYRGFDESHEFDATDPKHNRQHKIVTSNTATNKAFAGAYTGDEITAQNPTAAKSGVNTGLCYAMGIVRHGVLNKNVSFRNEPIEQRCKLTWTVEAYEWYQDVDFLTHTVPQQSGVFYDLLPLGGTFAASTLYVEADGTELEPGDYSYTLTSNWRGSGRTMLTLTIVEPTDSYYKFVYSTYHTWDDLSETGAQKKNVVAYETGNDNIGNGYPDNAGSLTGVERSLMTGLDGNTTDRRFLYTTKQYEIKALTAGDLGLYKQVMAEGDEDYSYSTMTVSGGNYSYKIRFTTDAITKAYDLIVFDSLENFAPYDETESDWHGILQSIDLTTIRALEGQGGKHVAPVVYYSTLDAWRSTDPDTKLLVGDLQGLEPENGPDYDFSAYDAIWTPAADYTGDMADVKAFAIDLRKAEDGEEFIMKARSYASITVNMKAPDTVDDLDPSDLEYKAYNNIFLFNTVSSILPDAQGASELIFQNYTQIGYRLAGRLKLLKIDQQVYETTDPHELQPVQGIRFKLWGTSNYGTDIEIIRTSNAWGEVVFDNLEYGTYELQEIAGIPDYQQNYITMTVTVDENGNVFIGDPVEDPENPGQYIYNYDVYDGLVIGIREADGAYIIGNKPRVHGDLDFYKKGRVDGSLTSFINMPQVTFKIEGVSAYGRRFSDQETPSTAIVVTTDETGVGHILDLEKSSAQGYTMVETQTVDGYILSERVYKLYCDETGVTMTYVDDDGNEVAPESFDPESGTFAPDLYLDASGKYVVVNEPYHVLDLYKYNVVNATNVGGAKFSLTGSGYYDEQTSTPDGYLSFTGLKAGVYALQEIEAPDGFQLNGTIYTVVISNDGSVTIDDQTIEEAVTAFYGVYNNAPEDAEDWITAFPIANEPETVQITIVKYWEGLEEGETPPTPTLHLSADPPVIPANYATISRALWFTTMNNAEETAPGTFLLRNSAARSFGHYTGDWTVEEVEADPSWKRIDDGLTNKKVWAKLFADGMVGWVSDATTVYLPENCASLFSHCTGLTAISTAGLNSSRVTSIRSLFRLCTGLVNADGQQLQLSNLNTANVTDMAAVFFGCSNLQNLDLVSNWETSNVRDMTFMFSDCLKLVSLDLHRHTVDGKECWNVGKLEKTTSMFQMDRNGPTSALKYLNLKNWNTSSLTDMAYMFYNCRNLTSWKEGTNENGLDLSGFDTSGVKTLHCTFYYCEKLESIDVSNWDTHNLTCLQFTFNQCHVLGELDLSNWFTSDDPSVDAYNLVSASYAFQGCHAIKRIYATVNWNASELASWAPTATVTSFESCPYSHLATQNNNVVYPTGDHFVFYGSGDYQLTSLKGSAGTAWNSSYVSAARARVDGGPGSGEEGYFWDPDVAVPNSVAAPMSAAAQPAAAVYAVDGGGNDDFGEDFIGFDAYSNSGSKGALLTSLGEYDAVVSRRSVSGPIAEQVSNPAGWVQNEDGSWTYTFDIYDADYVYYLWEEEMSGWVGDAYRPDGVITLTYHKDTQTLTADPADRLIEYPEGNVPPTYAVKITNTKGVPATTELKVQKVVQVGDTVVTTDPTAFDIAITLYTDEELTEVATDINGMYGNVSFENGVGTITLHGGESTTALNLPIGLWYKVTESDPGSPWTVTYSNRTGQLTDGCSITVTVTNSKPASEDTGGFSITKTVVVPEGVTPGEDDNTRTFQGSVTLYTDADCTVVATEVDGLRGELIFTDGVAPWALSHGQTKTVSDLPTDLYYKVVETGENGWTATYTGQIGQVDASVPAVVVTNTKVEVPTNGFTVLKTAVGYSNDPTFGVYVELAGLGEGKTYSYVVTYADGSTETMTFTASSSGAATNMISLKGGESAAFSDLPVGATYRVYEQAGSTYIAAFTVVNSGTGGSVVTPSGSNTQPNTGISTATETLEEDEAVLVTLTNTNPKCSISGEKVWNDSDNVQNRRPDAIMVYLMRGAQQVRELMVTAADNWAWTFDNLDRFDNYGEEIVYTVEEGEVEDDEFFDYYNVTYTGNMTDGFVITNTLITDTIPVTVTKVWIDNNNADGLRQPINVSLYADGTWQETVELNEDNGWAYTWAELQKYRTGTTEEIVYTVTESGISNYSSEISGDMTNGFVVTNTRTIGISGQKFWNDDDNAGGTRPDTITVRLMKSVNGSEPAQVGVTTAGAANNWSWSWSGLPKYETVGETTYEIVYSVTEDPVDGYAVTYSGYNITNTLSLTQITINKTWDDDSDRDGLRSGVVAEMQLYKTVNGVKTAVGDPVAVGAADGWSYTWTNLPQYESGYAIQYSVKETLTTANGYAIIGGEEVNVPVNGSGTITNRHTPERISIDGQKNWVDNGNAYNTRPETITIRLWNGNTEVANTTASAADNWAWSFTNLYKYENHGTLINYTVTEDAVPGYTTTVNGYVITNTLGGTTSATVRKVWSDENDRDGIRPESLTVTLSNGQTVTLNDANNWQATVNDLPMYDANGALITYTWTEGTLPEGYTLTDTSVNGTVTTLTNSYTPERININGSKTWADEDNTYNTRPETITVRLWNGNTEVANTTATAPDWAWSFTNLYKYENQGTLINYTVTEDAVPGYTTTVNGYAITNTLERGDLQIAKTIANGAADTLFTVSIEAQKNNVAISGSYAAAVTGNGETRTENVTFTNGAASFQIKGGETWLIQGLPAGTAYTVAETNLPGGWTLTSSTGLTGTITVETTASAALTNSYSATGTLQLAGTKRLQGRRLSVNEFEFRLIDSENTVLEVVSNAADGSFRFTDITYTLADVGTHVYTVDEVIGSLNRVTYDTTVFTVTVVVTDNGDGTLNVAKSYKAGTTDATGITFTNKYRADPPEPELVSVTVTKVWADSNNEVGDRPESVTVVLLRNGEETAMTAVLSAANKWSYTFTNLPKEDGSGKAYDYSVKEQEIEGYTVFYSGSAASGFVITNVKEVIDILDEDTPTGPVVPKTGDESRIFLWLALGLASLGGVALLNKKRKEEEA